MSEVGDLRHEVAIDSGTGLPLLHVYLPEGLAQSDVDLTTESKPKVLEVFIEHVESGRIMGVIKLPDYRVPDDDVKYSKKHRRFTLRLQSSLAVADAAEPPTAVCAVPDCDNAYSVSEQLPGNCSVSNPPVKHTASPASSAPTSTSQPPSGSGNSFGLLDNDDISDDESAAGGEGAEAAGKKKRKKKKKGKKMGSSGDVQGEAETDAPTANGNHANGGVNCAAGAASSGDDVESAPVISEGGAVGAAKKKKKKKKKINVSIAAAVEGGAAVGVEAEEETLPGCSSPRAPPTPPELSTSLPNSVPESGLPSAPASAPISKHASRAVLVDMEEDFGEDSVGTFDLGTVVDHDPLLGPAVHSSLGKVQVKGEDKWLEAPTNAWSFKGLEGTTPVSAFGIFDGHGGRMAAQHAAKYLLPLVARFAERAVGTDVPGNPGQLASEGYIISEQGEIATGFGDDEAALKRASVMAAQDALIARLPKALHAGFVQCDADVVSRHKSSGTTATLAVQVGWELLVANVGDSLAYLDTGSEIVVISANHRVAESTEEQERILMSGGRIKPAMYGEDDPDGEVPGTATPHEGVQLRVWPGGINMTRTIGDDSAGGLLIAEPSVRQVSLPVTGARLIIASDGLWDAVNAKTVIGQLRTCSAREAASRAAVYAMRNKKHDDDVTVVVADFVPRESDTHVPGLLKRTSGPAAVALTSLAAVGMKEGRAVQSWRPLESHSESWRERHRAHRQRAAVYLHQLALAEKAELEAAAELDRQRRMAIAPAAGTAGVGTAVRLPVSETYKELSELKVSLEALEDMGDEPAAGEDDWTQVDAKKKKDTGFDMRKELMRAARPGEGKSSRSPGGGNGRDEAVGRDERPEGSGRRERRERGGADRDRRATRRGRADIGAATSGSTIEPAIVEVSDGRTAEAAVEQQQQQADHHRQQASRGERREGGGRRERGGRGGRNGARSGGPHVPAPSGELTSAATAPAASSVPTGVVKAAGYLFVPKSVLYSGAVAPAGAAPTPSAREGVGADATSTATDGAGGNKPRRDRMSRVAPRNRRDGAAPPSSAPQNLVAGDQHSGEVASASAEGDIAPASAVPRQNMLQRRRQQREAVSAAAAVTNSGLSEGAATTGRPAAAAPVVSAATHIPAASSGDPAVVRDPATGHRQRRPQHAHGASQSVPAPPAQPGPTAGSSHHHSRPVQQGTTGHGSTAPPAGTNPSRNDGHYPKAVHSQGQPQPSPPQPQPHARPESYQQSRQQAHQHTASQPTHQHQQRASAASAAPRTAVPTYAGPLDFGAGFGPGSSMWPPSEAQGQYGGYSANGGAAPQRPPGLGSGAHRSPDEIAAAAAAAAAAAVARKAAASKGAGGSHGQHAQRQT